MIEVRRTQPMIHVAPERDAPFEEIHTKHRMDHDDPNMYEIPLELVAAYLVKHKDDPAAYGVIHDVIANSGVTANIGSIRAGSTHHNEVLEMHSEDHLLTDTGGNEFLQLRLEAVCAIYGAHHNFSDKLEGHLGMPVGGKMSQKAISVLDEFLAEVGLKPNHKRIMAEFCQDCARRARVS